MCKFRIDKITYPKSQSTTTYDDTKNNPLYPKTKLALRSAIKQSDDKKNNINLLCAKV